jgi:hypothetical protein
MTKLFTISAIFSLIITSVSFTQHNKQTIIDEPHEQNLEQWFQKFPHSFTPLNPPGSNPEFISDFLNINISNDPFPQNEPSVKISRTDPNRVVAAWRDFRTGVNPPLRRVGFSYSTDGGESWSVSELLPQIIPGALLSSDPVVGVDLDGNFYIYTVSLNENTGSGELWVFKSTDGGENFNEVHPMALGPGFEDKEWATADLNPASPYANNLYCSWTRFLSGSNILLIKSADQGVNWSSPVSVSDGSGVQGSFPAVGPNGEVYVVWTNGEQIMFDRSDDGADTFGTDIVVSNAPNSWFPTMDVDLSGGERHGYIFVTWNDQRNGDDDVFLSYSSDRGTTWLNTPIRVNNDPVGNGKIQYWPGIAVGDDGTIAIIFYDTRNTPNNSFIEAYLARSTDGGLTFTNGLVSSEPSPTSIPNGDVRFGDYINIDYVGDKIVPVWTDERAGGVDMDIYTAVINQIIPVELTSFAGRVVDGKTILEWTTATELNNLGFEIERASASSATVPEGTKPLFNEWIRIGFVEGNGTTAEPQHYSFSDTGLGGVVYYRLKQIDFNGSYKYSNIIDLNTVSVTTLELSQNYPNPFNPSTAINYQIGNVGFVSLIVFNSLGEKVSVLINAFKPAGSYKVTFDASELPSGIYVYTLTAGSYLSTKKMILIR